MGVFPEEISFQYLPTRVGLALIVSEIIEVKGDKIRQTP
jgi:hypothetical protein